MSSDTDRRARLLYLALGFLGLDVPPTAMPPELLHARLDTWQVGDMVTSAALIGRAFAPPLWRPLHVLP